MEEQEHSKYYWKELLSLFVGVGIVLFVGWIVIDQQVTQVNEYCDSLVLNGTINNRSECNVTIQAMAEINSISINKTEG